MWQSTWKIYVKIFSLLSRDLFLFPSCACIHVLLSIFLTYFPPYGYVYLLFVIFWEYILILIFPWCMYIHFTYMLYIFFFVNREKWKKNELPSYAVDIHIHLLEILYDIQPYAPIIFFSPYCSIRQGIHVSLFSETEKIGCVISLEESQIVLLTEEWICAS